VLSERSRSEQWDWKVLRTRCEREARRVLHDRQDAEDAVQEAMARAWRNRERCRSPDRPLPWLLQITRNESLRLLQRRQSAPNEVAIELAEAHEAPGNLGGERLAANMDVRRALARLSMPDRGLAYLRYDEDLAQNRIAQVLDMPEGTVKVRLHRLRQKLRMDLKEGYEGNHQPQ
jgi:RNA polymerase sigma-70 factor, ECF subfamily